MLNIDLNNQKDKVLNEVLFIKINSQTWEKLGNY
jgi:hypothetical protein